MNRYEAGKLLQDLTGGASPNHGDTIIFDQVAGWIFAPRGVTTEELEESQEEQDEVLEDLTQPLILPFFLSNGASSPISSPVVSLPRSIQFFLADGEPSHINVSTGFFPFRLRDGTTSNIDVTP